MIAHAIFFYIFSFIAVISAIMVTVSKNTVHSVFFLILDFISISCLFIMIGAEFLGMIMLIVYVGAVAALFFCVGVVYQRMHTRMIRDYGGIISIMPKFAIVFMIFVLGGVGIPGTSGFVGEFLILMGAFKESFLVATIASLGVILSAAYMLWLYKRVVFGELVNKDLLKMLDIKRSEIVILISLAIPSLFFGFYPEPLLSTVEVSISSLIENHNYSIQNSLVSIK